MQIKLIANKQYENNFKLFFFSVYFVKERAIFKGKP